MKTQQTTNNNDKTEETCKCLRRQRHTIYASDKFETPEEGIAHEELNRRHFEYRECHE